MTDVRNVPDGSGGALVLVYNSPIDVDVPTGTIPSLFPDVLGTSDDNTTLVGALYQSLYYGKTAVNEVAMLAD